MKKIFVTVLAMLLALSASGLAEGLEAYVGIYVGQDPWENPLTVEIEAVEDGKLTWRYTEDFAGQALEVAFEGTELTDGAAQFHVEGAVRDNENTTCDYTGTLELKDGAVTVTYAAGQMTESSPEGGNTAYHVEALDEAARAVTLQRAEGN